MALIQTLRENFPSVQYVAFLTAKPLGAVLRRANDFSKICIKVEYIYDLSMTY